MPDLLYRHLTLRAEQAEGDTVVFAASSEEPVDRWGDAEILTHRAECVRLDRLRTLGALLVNHDPDQRVGAILSAELDGTVLRVKARFLTTAAGKDAATEVREGSLRGVSVGYVVHRWDVDEQARTMTAVDWEPYEVSLTPVPADPTVGIGRNTITKEAWKRFRPTTTPRGQRAAGARTMDHEALVAAIAALLEQGATAEAISAAIAAANGAPADPPATDTTTDEPGGDDREDDDMSDEDKPKGDETARAAALKITKHAESLGLRASEFLAMPEQKAMEAMIRKVAEGQGANKPKGPVGPSGTRVTDDAADKFKRRATASFLRSANWDAGAAEKAGLGLREEMRQVPLSFSEIATRSLIHSGIDDARDMTRMEVADLVLGERHRGFMSRAANKTSGFFTSLLANVMDKVVARAFAEFPTATYQIWTTPRPVEDFKQVSTAGLQMGDLTEVAENIAFPEITANDSGYNSTLGLFGATLSLSLQTIVNDDLGEFMRQLARAGSIAARTVDKNCYQVLMDATWTNDSTGSAALGTAGSLDLVRTALAQKRGPAGEYLGIAPRYLLHPFALTKAAQEATGALIPPGQQTAVGSLAVRSIIPVESIWLSDSTVSSNQSTSSYYLTGDPNQVDTVQVLRLNSMAEPMVAERDAGATAKRVFVVMYPHRATVATHTARTTPGGQTTQTRVTGVQRGTT